jgi:hypothetical protein
LSNALSYIEWGKLFLVEKKKNANMVLSMISHGSNRYALFRLLTIFFSSFLIISGSKEKDVDDREDREIEGGS